jgi:hypothetical protein
MGRDEGLGKIAGRWLKKSIDELTATDRHERADASRQANVAEHDFKEKLGEEAVFAAVPGLKNWRDEQEAAEAEREQRRADDAAAEIAARPLAGVGLTLSGSAEGSWSGQLPAKVERIPASAPDPEELEYNRFVGEASVRVDLQPPLDAQPVVGGRALVSWTFVIPGYAGPGTYDLTVDGQERQDAGQLDPLDIALTLDDYDEPYYWYADVPGSIDVGDDERSLVVRMTMGSASGEIQVVASVNLPA